jgi:hypothetical protein
MGNIARQVRVELRLKTQLRSLPAEEKLVTRNAEGEVMSAQEIRKELEEFAERLHTYAKDPANWTAIEAASDAQWEEARRQYVKPKFRAREPRNLLDLLDVS